LRSATIFRLTAFTLVLLILAGCKTQKRKGELTPLGKAYHNVTAEYNGYFNADVLLMESRQQLIDQHNDNYTRILPLYEYRAAENPRMVAEALDRAIEKVSIVVALHRGSDWDDDCYLLIGEAQYLKQDFESAEETLEYMVEEYNPRTMKQKKRKKKSSGSSAKKSKDSNKSVEKLKKEQRKEREKAKKKKKKKKKKGRKKKGKKGKKKAPSRDRQPEKELEEPDPIEEEPEEEEPEEITPGKTKISLDEYDPELEEDSDAPNYFLKHRPAYQEGLLWLTRTYIERGKYLEAQKLIFQLNNSTNLFNDVQRDLAAVEAYFFLKQEKYALAIEPLEKAIDLERDRQRKARYAFIQAQIHEKLGRSEAAYAAYEKVLAYRPAYVMEFRTRLNMTQSAKRNGLASTEETRKELNRMLKDEKNIEYQDQIYFAMAEIDLEEGLKGEAMANLRNALNKSQGNTAQRTEAFLLLADLHFESENFVKAKLYYDSTLSVMGETDERYVRVSGMANNLTEIAESLQTIELQDSLLRISQLSEEEKKALAFEIKKKKDEEARQQLLEKQAGNKLGGGAPIAGGGRPQAGAGNSDFFAYDDRALKRGARDFQNRWGDRILEDDWRRSSKSGGGFADEELAPEERPSSVLTEDDISSILKDVPDTPEEVAKAEQSIMEAYFTLGRLYRDRLENNEKAVDALETLLERFPDTEYKLDAYYYLYLAYTDLNELNKAQRYYDKIVQGFPGSTYAQILIDPQFLEKTADREAELNMFYDAVYADFQRGEYQLVASRIQEVPEKFGNNNTLQPRFELLNAMCLGKLEGKDSYVKALQTIIEKYPEAPEEKRAKEILRLLGEYVTTGPKGGTTSEEKADLFKFAPDQQHYIMVVLQTEGGASPTQLPMAKARVSDFHMAFYKTERLRISNIFLGDQENKLPILVIRRFENKDAAMDYYDTVQRNTSEFLDPNEFSYTVVAVSQDNYRQLLKNRSTEGYWPFFETYYLD
jgi:tetratricopeptide (TPR) repeat protein